MTYNYKNTNKHKTWLRALARTCLLVVSISIFFLFVPTAKAATIVKTVSSLGLSSGLVGYWTMDGADYNAASTTAEVLDRSGNGNHGNNSGATPTIGKLGQARSFDGVDDFVNAGSAASLDDIETQGGGGMTVSFWIKPTSNTTNSILNKGNNYAGTGTWQVSKASNTNPARLIFAKNGTVGAQVTYNSTLTIGVWQHVVITWNGSMTFSTGVNAYKNTAVLTTGAFTDGSAANSDAAHSLCMGAQGSACTAGFGDEALDEIRIYNRVLSTSEITRLYNFGSGKINSSQNTRLTGGLLGLWSFNGADYDAASTTAEVLDRSGNNRNSNAINGPSQTAGKVGQALNFDGSDDYIRTPSNFIGTSAATISAWVKARSVGPAGGGTFGRIISNDRLNLYANTSGGACGASQGCFELTSDGGSNALRSSQNSLKTNRWIFVVATRDSSGNGQIYIDGVLNASGTTGTPTNSGATSVIIGSRDPTNGTGAQWDGLIDEVRIYNSVLSAEEIKQLYNMSNTPQKVNSSQNTRITDGLVGLWSFNGADYNAASTTAEVLDRSGNNNNGNNSGATRTIGKVGQALSFDGTDDFVASGDIDVSDITISAWIKAGGWGDGGIGTILGKLNSFVFAIDDGTIGVDTLIFNDGDEWEAATASGITLGTWYFVTVTSNSTTVTFYINGVQAGSNVGTHTLGSTNNNVQIGKHDSSLWEFNGAIDEVRMYNRVLSAAEVKQLYDMGK
jgi:hypothetical protein